MLLPIGAGFFKDKIDFTSFVDLVFFRNVFLPGFTGFYWVLLGFTGFYLVLLGVFMNKICIRFRKRVSAASGSTRDSGFAGNKKESRASCRASISLAPLPIGAAVVAPRNPRKSEKCGRRPTSEHPSSHKKS